MFLREQTLKLEREMKYCFVGDLHGRYEEVDRAMGMPCDKLIFLGDIFDSWDRTVEDQFRTFEAVLQLVKDGEAECVWGNHEWSYMHRGMSCSGYNYATQARSFEFDDAVRKYFKPYLYLEDEVLVTHAGLTGRLFNEDDICSLDAWALDYQSPFFWVGYARGGRAEFGGPLWCDFTREFSPIPGLTQVFGHTRGQGIRRIENSYCVDCLDTTKEFLTLSV